LQRHGGRLRENNCTLEDILRFRPATRTFEVDSRRRASNAVVDKLFEELREGIRAPPRGVDGNGVNGTRRAD
jgi:hypothetical protein